MISYNIIADHPIYYYYETEGKET